MFGIAGLLLVSAIGVDYGWKQTEDGKLEYIIQIKPEQLQSLADGDDIASFIHPDAKRVTCFRVRVGDGDVPRETVLTPGGPIEATPASGIDDPYGNHRPTLRTQPGFSRVSDQQGTYGPTTYGSAPHFGPTTQQYAPNTQQQYGPTTQHYGPTPDYQQNQWNQANNYRADPYAGSYSQRVYSHLDPADDPLMHRYGQSTYPSYGNYGNSLASAPRMGSTQTYRTGTTTTNPTFGFTNGTMNRTMQPAQEAWWPLFFTSTLLFLSLGGNAYLGWIAAEFYTRYRDTVERMRAERRY